MEIKLGVTSGSGTKPEQLGGLGFKIGGNKIVTIPAGEVMPLKDQPRLYFDPSELEALGKSIRDNGQAQPALVIKLTEPKDGFKYQLIDGERRLRSIKLFNLPTIRAVIVDVKDERQHHLLSLISNFNRADHTHAEKTKAVFEMRVNGTTVDNIAIAVGKSIGWVNSYISLNRLEPSLLARLDPPTVDSEKLSFALALQLASVRKMEEQLKLYETIQEDRKKGVSPVVINEKFRRTIRQANVERGSLTLKGEPRKKKLSDDLKAFQSLVPRVEATTMKLEDFPDPILYRYYHKCGYAEMEKLMTEFRKCAKILTGYANTAEAIVKMAKKGTKVPGG